MTTYTILQLPVEERPRERLKALGAEALPSSELVAIILGSGMQGKTVVELSRELLGRFGGLQGLAEATVEELMLIKGLGPAKAIQLRAALALGLRAAQQGTPARTKIARPEHAYQYVRERLEGQKQEHLLAILLDIKGYVIRAELVAKGSLNEAVATPREILAPAIRHQAAGLIVVHNHPSGDPTPSDADITFTRRLVAAASLMEIPMHDHLVVGANKFVSMKEAGLWP